MVNIEKFTKEVNKYKGNLRICFEKGRDAAINGATTENCHFGLFATKEMSDAWSAGNKAVGVLNENSVPQGN